MRSLALFALALISAPAAAEEGPWSAPAWYVGATERHGDTVLTTAMYVSRGPGHDVVDLHCTRQDLRTKAVTRRRIQAAAQMAQGLWCGDGQALGRWCVDLREGAPLKWYGPTPCAAGPATFGTGD